MDRGKLPIVGLVGGIASGKSMIADQFRRAGAAVISADQLAHEVLRYDEVKRAARERWGDGIFGPDGEVDRSALAKIVFAPPPDGPRELTYLEQLIHPDVGRLVQRRLAELQAGGPAALQTGSPVTAVVLDVPLLVESGWHEFCDRIVYVDAPLPERLSRALARGWSQQDFERREAAQHSLAQKRAAADLVIDNSGSIESAQSQVAQFCHRLFEQFPRN
ncbi:MAG: dephospho-CoA kinase [Pirellulales bacterium]